MNLYEILQNSGRVGEGMTHFERLFAQKVDGGKISEISGVPPLRYIGNGRPLTDYLISGNTVQDGTPSADAPMDAVGSGVRTGNLFDTTTLENGIYLAASGNKYGDATNGVRAGTKIKVLPNTAYTLSAQSSANVSLRIFEWGNSTFIKQTPKYNISGSVNLTVTTTAETTEIAFNIEGENGQYATNIMLNLGSTALPYEPYGFKLPLTVNATEYPIYLGQAETTRRIKKLVLTGEEANWYYYENATGTAKFFYLVVLHTVGIDLNSLLNTHGFSMQEVSQQSGSILIRIYAVSDDIETVEEWKSYLAAQYANGTPVTVWYVLVEPETAVVNEPLMKIGDYADTVSAAQAGVTIPTVNGENVLDVPTEVKPSDVWIRGRIKEV